MLVVEKILTEKKPTNEEQLKKRFLKLLDSELLKYPELKDTFNDQKKRELWNKVWKGFKGNLKQVGKFLENKPGAALENKTREEYISSALKQASEEAKITKYGPHNFRKNLPAIGKKGELDAKTVADGISDKGVFAEQDAPKGTKIDAIYMHENYFKLYKKSKTRELSKEILVKWMVAKELSRISNILNSFSPKFLETWVTSISIDKIDEGEENLVLYTLENFLHNFIDGNEKVFESVYNICVRYSASKDIENFKEKIVKDKNSVLYNPNFYSKVTTDDDRVYLLEYVLKDIGDMKAVTIAVNSNTWKTLANAGKGRPQLGNKYATAKKELDDKLKNAELHNSKIPTDPKKVQEIFKKALGLELTRQQAEKLIADLTAPQSKAVQTK